MIKVLDSGVTTFIGHESSKVLIYFSVWQATELVLKFDYSGVSFIYKTHASKLYYSTQVSSTF